MKAFNSLVFLALCGFGPLLQSADSDFSTISLEDLDPTTFQQSVSGRQSAVAESEAKGGPRALVWTQQSRPEWRGVKFGEGRDAATRHLRIGFHESLSIGSVLIRGGGRLSVLRPEAPYPGDLEDDSQWISAERLDASIITQQEVDQESYAFWLLPPKTRTRAIRCSHTPNPGDREMSGWVGGIWIMPDRMMNIAPQSLATTIQREDISARLIDGSNNRTWQAWENHEKGNRLIISKEHPETITLTWPAPVDLKGLCLLWSGFSEVEVETFTGENTSSIVDASPASWKQIAQAKDLDPLYPMALGPQWIPFDRSLSTRALRLRITRAAKPNHPHLVDKVQEGRRVWLGELMALSTISDKESLGNKVLPQIREEPPPIPIRFTLQSPGVVTLVVEDLEGHRVRNLISESPFPSGENTVWWDGSDDLLRDPEAARHGVYHIPTRLVNAGEYQIRGIVHQPFSLRYECSIYNAGKPAWVTADGTGCWLTTHTPPTSLCHVPGERTADGLPLIFMGAFVAEGGHGLQWLREDGSKLGGQGWVGGTWTGAPTLATDTGNQPILDHLCYVGSIWEGELRLTAKTKSLADQSILKLKLGDEIAKQKSGAMQTESVPMLEGFDGGDKRFVLGGIAAYNGILVCSLVRQNELVFIDIATGKIARRATINTPRGMCFDRKGQLYVLSGHQLVRWNDDPLKTETIIDSDLADPRHVQLTADQQFYISDRGDSHQVKSYTFDGKRLHNIGKPGLPRIGDYDPEHLNNPNGLAIDSQGRLWVAEADNYPRRVSVWSPQGSLVCAYYGPTEYGGGGVLDPRDPTKFFYKGMEFSIDWKEGTDQLVRVFARPDPLLDAHYGHYSPDTPLYPFKDQTRFFTSCYTHTPTNGDNVAFVWRDGNDNTRLAAAIGDVSAWSVLHEPAFHSRWPEGTSPNDDRPKPEAMATFAWSDLSLDGVPQPEEIQIIRGRSQGVTVMNDLSFVIARHDQHSVRLTPKFDKELNPLYDLAEKVILGPAGGIPASSGGNQALTEPSGWTITTNAPLPYSPYGLGGMFRGTPRWSYPSPWPGLHASHEAAVPDRPGMVVGHTRLLGGWIDSPIGPMFCINGNMGNMYLFTADGLFVSTLFHDIRVKPNWSAPVAQKNMDVTQVSLHDENFWPSITQTKTGETYLVDGARTSLVRIDGLDTVKGLPTSTVKVTEADLHRATEWFAKVELQRQKMRGNESLNVLQRKSDLTIDGRFDDWAANTQWVYIDRRGIKANFNSDSRPYEVSAALQLSKTHLYAAFRTTEKSLLNNSGETPLALFKHGGCLDVMLATDTSADEQRTGPVVGDQRLLVTQVHGKTRALLYRPKVVENVQPVPFSSPWRTVTFDQVEDLSADVNLSADGTGNYEFSIPLAKLQWLPRLNQVYRGDLGVLRGQDGQTTQRVYWTNKATAITADIPSEAELTPRLWGKWRITE